MLFVEYGKFTGVWLSLGRPLLTNLWQSKASKAGLSGAARDTGGRYVSQRKEALDIGRTA